MVKIQARYLGDLFCQAIHEKSGSVLETEAPEDNQGEGRRFSPTDLVGTAMATCMLTIMGIQARTLGIDIDGAEISVEKTMSAERPRRIARIGLNFSMPAGIAAKHRNALRRAAESCPVHQSLHPEVETVMTWEWRDRNPS